MKRCLLIINPCAGKRTAVKNRSMMESVLHDHGYVCTTVLTTGRGDATKIAAQRQSEFDLILCSGGDGTLNEVVAGLIQTGSTKPVGYIPAGSTNDFASSLGISTDPAKALQQIVTGTPHPIDLGSFNGRVFTYIAACGAFTRASYAVPQEKKNQWGNLAYIAEGLRELPTIRSFPLVVKVGDACFEDEFWWFSVTNAKSVGGLIRLGDDQVNLGDGKLEVMLIRPGDVGRIFWALQTRKYDIPEISFCSADAVSIDPKGKMTWTLDGEEAESEGKIEIRCLPGALNLMI